MEKALDDFFKVWKLIYKSDSIDEIGDVWNKEELETLQHY